MLWAAVSLMVPAPLSGSIAGNYDSMTLTLGNASAVAGTALARISTGSLVIAPTNGIATLGVTEKLIINGGVNMTNGIISPTIIGQGNTTAKTGDFLADAGGIVGLRVATYTDINFVAPLAASIESVTSSTTLGSSAQVYALRVGTGSAVAATLNIGAGNTLTVGSGTGTAGVILNAGTAAVTIAGGTLAFGGAEGLLYAGAGSGNNTISSVITGTNGITIFGSGVLVLSGANTYSGATTINSGTLRMGAANSLPSAGGLNVGTGAFFDLASNSQTIGSMIGSGTVTLGTADAHRRRRDQFLLRRHHQRRGQPG